MKDTKQKWSPRTSIEKTKTDIDELRHEEKRMRDMLGMADLSEANRKLLQTQVDEFNRKIERLDSDVKEMEAELDAMEAEEAASLAAARKAEELQAKAANHAKAFAEYSKKLADAIKNKQPLPTPPAWPT